MMNGKHKFSDLKAPISRVLFVGMAVSAASVVTVAAPSGAQQVQSPVSPTVVNPTVPTTPDLGGTPLTGGTGTPTTPPVEPPVTQPPVTQPPVTQPPVTQPPVTQPPVTQPPVTQPPVTQPPVTQPPVTQPPVTQPPVTQPPVTQPPVTQPPVTQPPVTQPPVTQPPVTQPPVTQPPVTQPPVTPPLTFGPLDPAYVLATARALGVDPAVLFQTRVVQGSLRFGPDANSTLAAFEAKLREIGQFNIGSYNNESFANIFLNARNSSDILAIFRSINAERFALVGRLGRFGALPLRRAREFSRIRYTLISLTEVVVYQGANVRFLTFPPPRDSD